MEKIQYLKEYGQEALEEFAAENDLNLEEDGSFETGGTIAKLKKKYDDETMGVFIMNGGNSHGAVWRCVAIDREFSHSGEYES